MKCCSADMYNPNWWKRQETSRISMFAWETSQPKQELKIKVIWGSTGNQWNQLIQKCHPLIEGQTILVQCKDTGLWTYATVVEILGPSHEYRSCVSSLLMASGRGFVHNIEHLKSASTTAASSKWSFQSAVMTIEQLIEYSEFHAFEASFC